MRLDDVVLVGLPDAEPLLADIGAGGALLGEVLGAGEGPSRRVAETAAAAQALETLRNDRRVRPTAAVAAGADGPTGT